MKRILAALLISGACLSANAQDLPKPSPSATLKQRVGLTDITIDYSRPGMKGREVYGHLVPFDELWRTGANMNTTIEFSTAVTIQGQALKPGKYSVFTIPQEGMWTIIFNKKTDHPGTAGYAEENDVLRAEAKVMELSPAMETFTIGINDIADESAALVMMWENTLVKLPFTVEVRSLAMKNIESAIAEAKAEDKWRVYRNAANYFHNSKTSSDKALEYIEMSLASNNESWYSYWLKAEILAEQGDYKQAIKAGEMAKKVGMSEAKSSGEEFAYAAMIETGITSWKAMK